MLNGKFRCLETNDSYLTVDKIYDVKDGVFAWDDKWSNKLYPDGFWFNVKYIIYINSRIIFNGCGVFIVCDFIHLCVC